MTYKTPSNSNKWITSFCFSWLLSFFFTHAGDDTPLLLVLFSLDYYLLLIHNFLVIWSLWLFTWHIIKRGNTLTVTIGVPYLLVIVQDLFFCYYGVFEFDATDFFTITLPFSLVCIVAVNFYHKKDNPKTTTRIDQQSIEQEATTAPLLLDTARGKVQLVETSLQMAFLDGHKITVQTDEQTSLAIVSTSLRQIFNQLTQTEAFFFLNRQAFAHRQAIRKYERLADGRLRVFCGDQNFLVSKNKAAVFKKWIEAS